MTITVRHATIDQLDLVAPLFDAYRRFYGQPADLGLARNFLAERFRHHQSVILLALDANSGALGFVQLYPSFSSVRARRVYVLNDLFVAERARGLGVASQLLDKAAEFARSIGAAALSLSTALDNAPAQRLYESHGWIRDRTFCTYELAL
jgi:ribosomal protein S18 acetylase RimI-like enzyme